MQFTILFSLLFHVRSFYRRIRDLLGGLALVFGYCSWLPFSFPQTLVATAVHSRLLYKLHFMLHACVCCCCCCPRRGKGKDRPVSLSECLSYLSGCLVSLFLLLAGPHLSFPTLHLQSPFNVFFRFQIPPAKVKLLLQGGSSQFWSLSFWPIAWVAIRQRCTVLVHREKL